MKTMTMGSSAGRVACRVWGWCAGWKQGDDRCSNRVDACVLLPCLFCGTCTKQEGFTSYNREQNGPGGWKGFLSRRGRLVPRNRPLPVGPKTMYQKTKCAATKCRSPNNGR